MRPDAMWARQHSTPHIGGVWTATDQRLRVRRYSDTHLAPHWFCYCREDSRAAYSWGRYPDAIELLYASPQLFERAIEADNQYSDHQLSFTDAIAVVMVAFHDIDAVVSFDDDFDGIVDRRAPATIAGACG